jgi:hypothetical protein
LASGSSVKKRQKAWQEKGKFEPSAKIKIEVSDLVTNSLSLQLMVFVNCGCVNDSLMVNTMMGNLI